MSTFAPATLVCRCGHRFEVEVANGLHVSTRPELRQSILDGTFHRWPCPACGAVAQVDKLLAYTDFERRHFFTVLPERELARRRVWTRFSEESFRATMVERAAPIVRTWAPGMLRRVIFGLPALREKLVILDEDLDDRVIEALKLELRRTLGLADPFAYLHLVRRRSSFELVLEVDRLDGGGGTEELVLPFARYQDLAAAGPEALAARLPGMDELVVDHRVVLVPDESVGDPELPTVVPPPPMGEAPAAIDAAPAAAAPTAAGAGRAPVMGEDPDR